ncbi:MAG TPA: hypothetical protein VLX44_05900 [Xanthobacteraceae bacterium]|nr:hypothetical protein [Xanthobacteraceae bacterium]
MNATRLLLIGFNFAYFGVIAGLVGIGLPYLEFPSRFPLAICAGCTVSAGIGMMLVARRMQ